MNLKTSPFVIQDKKIRDLDLAKVYPTLKDLMKEQNFQQTQLITGTRNVN